MKRITVIGGGAAGMMSAIAAAEKTKNNPDGCLIVLLERNEKLGKKIYITGKGRCNFTNTAENSEFLENIIRNPKFMYSAIKCLNSSGVIDLFKKWGLNSKIERGGRVFPESDKASDVTKALTYALNKNNVQIHLNTYVESVTLTDGVFKASTTSGSFVSDAVIIATGGVSYPSTGSTGDGLKFAKNLGHKIVDLKPALVPISLTNSDSGLEGVSLKNVTLNIYENNEVIASEFGEMLFTKDGISGPIVLKLSSRINRKQTDKLYACIDLKPALSETQLDARILRDFDLYINKQLKNSLDDLLPKSLIRPVIKAAGIDEDKTINQITSKERALLVNAIKKLSFKIKKLADISVGVVTSGGIEVSGIYPNNMMSRLVNGLFFAGELIDVDAYTGGFNMQIAFSTGYLAGLSAANYISKTTD